jgi:hypothetical protein
VAAELDQSDENTDYESDNAEGGARGTNGKQKRKKRAKPAINPALHTTFEHRDVRCIIGVSQDAAQVPELWFYVHERPSDKSSTQRNGWWLDLNEDGGDPELRYMAGPRVKIQPTKEVVFPDVGVFPKVRFRRTCEHNRTGGEKRGKIRMHFTVPLSAAQLGMSMETLNREARDFNLAGDGGSISRTLLVALGVNLYCIVSPTPFIVTQQYVISFIQMHLIK